MGLFGKKKEVRKMFGVRHVEGLELPVGVVCIVSLFNGNLRIAAGSKAYTLQIEKLRGINYTSDVDVQKYTKSSTAKGIIGATTFGVAGAVIGSVPKTKSIVTINDTVIIHYLSAEGLKYIVLQDSNSDTRNAYEVYTMLQPLIPIVVPEQIDL